MTALNETDRLFYDETGMSKAKVIGTVAAGLWGSDGGELYLEQAFSESLSWSQGRLKGNGFAVSEGFGLRFVANDMFAFASSNELSVQAIKQAADTVKTVRHSATGGSIKLPRSRIIQPHYSEISPLLGLDNEKKIKMLSEIDAYVRAKDPRVKQVDIGLSGESQAVQIIRADGHRVADIRPLVRMDISVTVEQNGRQESAHHGFGGRMAYNDVFNESAWKEGSDIAIRRAITNLDSVPAPVGEMTVVMGSGWPGVMLHEAIGHGLEGDANRIGASVFAGKIGEQVAARGVTVIDQGNIPDRRGSLNYDDEGIKTQRNVLVEDGLLKAYMQDTMNARLMGVAPTGNGRRESFEHPPIPRMTNTFMEAGQYSPEDIIASVQHGIYAPNFGGGQVDPTSGKFVFEMTEAYLIKGGVIMPQPLKGATLIGNSMDAMKQIKMVGNDLALDPGVGTCGKGGQSVPVGIGQPTVRLDGLTIGGTG